jgi:xanthine dehydrogenase YagS FAD-binding subunit
VTLPKPLGGTHVYRKVRDRASYAFALISVAAVTGADGKRRFAIGGVAHKPWRVEAAEAQSDAKRTAEAVLAGAKTTQQNAFKVPLVTRTIASIFAETRA